MSNDEIYYQAMLARDHRFDGKFYVGVKTTGIYCRPICPARHLRKNVEFFRSASEGEKNKYRPCLRCRPECAPRSPAWIGTSAIVQRAVKALSSFEKMKFHEEDFASLFGVSARHLRRLFHEEIGKTPKQLFYEARLNLARQLIVETNLSMLQVAEAAGFESLRRFNAAFKDRFRRSPREIRRSPLQNDSKLQISLAYRPPYDFEGLLKSYGNHLQGELEWITANTYHRVIDFNGCRGVIAVSDQPESSKSFSWEAD